MKLKESFFNIATIGISGVGAPTLKGLPTYYLTNFSRKLQENEEILAWGRTSLVPSRSATSKRPLGTWFLKNNAILAGILSILFSRNHSPSIFNYQKASFENTTTLKGHKTAKLSMLSRTWHNQLCTFLGFLSLKSNTVGRER